MWPCVKAHASICWHHGGTQHSITRQLPPLSQLENHALIQRILPSRSPPLVLIKILEKKKDGTRPDQRVLVELPDCLRTVPPAQLEEAGKWTFSIKLRLSAQQWGDSRQHRDCLWSSLILSTLLPPPFPSPHLESTEVLSLRIVQNVKILDLILITSMSSTTKDAAGGTNT